ncbi:MAG: hypothetical protein A2413_12605, partial [Treponema sp. RIFOXYC1_FULL_61_9]
LFFRELGFPLREIRRITGNPDFDATEALREHRRRLLEKAERLGRLLDTIDKTIAAAEKEGSMLSDKDLYEGFSAEKAELWKSGAKAKYGETYEESDRKLRGMTKEEFKAIMVHGGTLETELMLLKRAGLSPVSAQAQDLAARWREHIENFWLPTSESFSGLGSMYVDDPAFHSRYEAMEPGLAEFMRDAIHAYARDNMDV